MALIVSFSLSSDQYGMTFVLERDELGLAPRLVERLFHRFRLRDRDYEVVWSP